MNELFALFSPEQLAAMQRVRLELERRQLEEDMRAEDGQRRESLGIKEPNGQA